MRLTGSTKHGRIVLRRWKVKSQTITNLILFILIAGLLIGAGAEVVNHLQTNIHAQIDAQVNLKAQEAIKQFEVEYKANRKLYKAIYTSSFKQQEFYFKTNGNPFEIAKKHLPDKWTGLKIEEVQK